MNQEITPFLKEIFETLSRGNFISTNSKVYRHRQLFNQIEEHFESLHEYFGAIGFSLEAGNNYYYFSKEEINYVLERKIEAFYKYIDILAFFADFDNSFGEGYQFSMTDIEQKSKVDTNLQQQLLNITHDISDNSSYYERVSHLVRKMTKEGFFECEDDERRDYRVLSAYNYLQSIVKSIDIDYEEEVGE